MPPWVDRFSTNPACLLVIEFIEVMVDSMLDTSIVMEAVYMTLRSYIVGLGVSPSSDIFWFKENSSCMRTWPGALAVTCLSSGYGSEVREEFGMKSGLMDNCDSGLVPELHPARTMTNPIIKSNNLCIINYMTREY